MADVHDLHTFMKQVTDEMSSEYQRIFARAAEDPGTAGDEGEENWATLLREWLPPNYQVVTKGRIIGYDGTMSPQIDVLVLKPSYPKKLLEKKIWLAGGVVAAFECKTTLTAAHVTDSVQRAQRFKSLFPAIEGSPASELRSPLLYGLLAHSHSWKGAKSKPLENINSSFESASLATNHPRLLLDLICIANLGTWSPMVMTCYKAEWAGKDADELRGVFSGEWGIATSMSCAAVASDWQQPTFAPVGALITSVTEALAWSDSSLRDLVQYYLQVGLGGSSSGVMRFWPPTIFSKAVRNGISNGRSTNGVPYNDWSMVISY